MFYGEHEHSLDKKSRFVLPAKFRETFKENYVEKLYLTRGLDRCLFLFTEEEWKSQEQKFKALPFTKSEARKFTRLYFAGATEIIPDKQGRILIPGYLKEYAGIQRQIMIVGIASRIEIWSREGWKEFYQKSREVFEDIAEGLIDLS